MTAKLLTVDSLLVGFGGRDARHNVLHGVSFSVGAAESVGLVGESGSGKSVTALAIMRLLGRNGAVTGGAIRFDGRDLASLPEREMRAIRGRRIAMVFQDPNTALNPAFTIGRQIGDVMRAHRALGRRQIGSEVLDVLERVGLPDPERCARSYPHELSGGMRQRALIAMAISCQPELLIADEPTTALDVTVQAQIVTLLKQLARDLGLSLLFITHNLDLMAELCDRAVVLYGGRVMEEDDVGELFERPRHPYTRLLLDSIPRLGAVRRAPQHKAKDGASAGCPFAPRCPRALDRCHQDVPPVLGAAERAVACWLYGAA